MKKLFFLFGLFFFMSACVIMVDGGCSGLKVKRFNIEEESKFIAKKPLTLRINTRGFIDTVFLVPSKDNTFTVKTEINATASTNFDDVRVKVEQKNNGTVSVKTVFVPDNGGVSICNMKGVSKITVFVPENTKKIVFYTSSSDLKCEGIKAREISIKTSSGDIFAKNLDCEEMGIDTSSGDISLTNAKIRELSVNSSSGDLIVNRCELGYFQADFSSGNIVARSIVNIEKGKIVTSSGDVTLKVDKFKRLKVNTSSGDIKLSILNPEKIYLYAKTNSGDFDINFPLPDGVKVKDNVLEFGKEGMPELDIFTSSGDISLSRM